MSNFRSMDGREVIAEFEKFGFSVVRIDGSHHIMKKEGYRNLISVPVHGHKAVKRGTLGGLIRAAGLTLEDFYR